MNRIFSNGGGNDYVIEPFKKLIERSSHVYLAAPYFTQADYILNAVDGEMSVQLLVGLNPTTCPNALRAVYKEPSIKVRYFTGHFHAKIYIFDDNAALLGSSNLTENGFSKNREAVICLDRPDDMDVIKDIRSLFLELWDAGQDLTKKNLETFTKEHRSLRQLRRKFDPDGHIEKAIGKVEPSKVKNHRQERKLTNLPYGKIPSKSKWIWGNRRGKANPEWCERTYYYPDDSGKKLGVFRKSGLPRKSSVWFAYDQKAKKLVGSDITFNSLHDLTSAIESILAEQGSAKK